MTNLDSHGKYTDGKKWSIFTGDALSILKKFSPDRYHCVITSPPYFWLRDYGVDGQIGHEDTIAEYVSSIVDVMCEVQRVLAPDGLLFLNLGDTYYSGKGESQGSDGKNSKRRFGLRAVDKSGGMGLGLQRKTMLGIPWRVAIKMTESGWTLRNSFVWTRLDSLTESARDRASRSYEYVFMFAKSDRYYFDREPLKQLSQEDVWEIPSGRFNNGLDTAPFPEELVHRCLEIGCVPGGHVLDPFCGSGTTLKAAYDTNRSATGIDLNPIFCAYAAQQLLEERQQQMELPLDI